MNAPFTTRPATKADASEIALLVNVATHGGIGMGWAHDARARGTYDPIEVGRLDMLDERDGLNWRNATIAESDSEVVGMLLGYPQPEEMGPLPDDLEDFLVPIVELEWLSGGHWFISMLAVHAPWRGQGVGSLLLELAETKRAEAGSRGLALITEDANVRARELYEREGFRVSASRPMRKYPDGTAPGRDWILMMKDQQHG
ncbi:GNAT family N-acetyltransferase [Devosia sp. A16]|uniref:GNAT family N-acetyltransferase n=1 Tax=Devosia sp. A16 TaxID=1736675 RepID=UPI0006D774CE|nr:GNAT family N-acetyltransferase [Devosia sp. A16]